MERAPQETPPCSLLSVCGAAQAVMPVSPVTTDIGTRLFRGENVVTLGQMLGWELRAGGGKTEGQWVRVVLPISSGWTRVTAPGSCGRCFFTGFSQFHLDTPVGSGRTIPLSSRREKGPDAWC